LESTVVVKIVRNKPKKESGKTPEINIIIREYFASLLLSKIS